MVDIKRLIKALRLNRLSCGIKKPCSDCELLEGCLYYQQNGAKEAADIIEHLEAENATLREQLADKEIELQAMRNAANQYKHGFVSQAETVEICNKRNNPKAGEVWKHFKGTRYRILAVGKHTESEEPMVVYQDADDSEAPVWIRPLDMFMHMDVEGHSRFWKLPPESLMPCPLCGEPLTHRINHFGGDTLDAHTAYCQCGFIFCADIPEAEFIRRCNRRPNPNNHSQ